MTAADVVRALAPFAVPILAALWTVGLYRIAAR